MYQELLDGYYAMRGRISNKGEEILEKISKLINKHLEQYTKKQFVNEMYSLMLELLTEVYSITSATVRDLYDIDVERLTDDEIMGLTFNEDGKELRDRIEEHYDSVMKRPKEERKHYLLHRMILIVNTESLVVSNGILYKKLAKHASYVEVINANDDVCWEHEECEYWLSKGKMPINELTKLPPYHPDCECMAIYYI